jgi:hypothetical protein
MRKRALDLANVPGDLPLGHLMGRVETFQVDRAPCRSCAVQELDELNQSHDERRRANGVSLTKSEVAPGL